MEEKIYQMCLNILREELIPAFGCTEPIAIAYAAAVGRKVLGRIPEKMTARCSGNIVKNVKGVVVPATDGMKGIEAAALIGAVGGDPDAGLETLHHVTQEDREQVRALLKAGVCKTELLPSKEKLHILLEMEAACDHVLIELCRTHTGIIRVEKNGKSLYYRPLSEEKQEQTDSSALKFQTIWAFAQCVKPEDVQELLERQISYNTKIAEYGLTHPYGAGIGPTLISAYGKDIKVVARALPAAGSDARMGGCEMPVVVNSGSGNQGMTVSLPVIAYAKELNASRELLYRALCISNLTAIYQKSRIGRLSAYCGAVSAAAGAGAGIAYLLGGTAEQTAQVVSNTLANVSGILCDGAKASCAAKIASGVEAALLAVEMTLHGQDFPAGEGVIQPCPDETVEKIATIAREGMAATDDVILKVMIG